MNPDKSPDAHIGIIIGIVIFLLLAIFLIVVFIGFGIADQPTNSPIPVPAETGTFLSSCTMTTCSNGLVCDGNTFVCKLPAGTVCSDFTDCVTGLICSGICATGAVGGLNQLCPCNTGYVCTQQSNLLTICKGSGGTTCTSNVDCASDLCQNNNTCAAGAPNAYPCTLNSACASQNCSNGFCQNSGIVSGTLGAACANQKCVGFTGAACNSTLSCQCLGETGIPGTCIASTQGIISTCSTNTFCSDDLICLDSSANSCTGGDTGCICVYSYPEPNTLILGSICIGGMFSSNGNCYNNNGLGCDSGPLCINKACGGGSVLAVYRFANTGTNNLLTNFVGATNTSILPAISGPTGIIQPYKMLASTSGNIDTIYLVDNLQGLLSVQYDPINNSVSSNWVQLIPHQTMETIGNLVSIKTLIDVGYNGSSFLVAFDEIVTGGVTGQNDTVYIGTNPMSLSPFNFQPGSGITGTQYTGTTPLSINYIDISAANDISPGGDTLISFNGTIYVKQSTQVSYIIGTIQGGPENEKSMSGTTGPARFYYDIEVDTGVSGQPVCPENGTTSSPSDPIQCPSYYNISFIGSFQSFGGGSFSQVLQFSGNIAGIAMPIDRFDDVQYEVFDYSIYSPTGLGMQSAGVIMLTNAYKGTTLIDNMVAVSFGGSTTLVPYRMSNTSRSVATANAFYIISIGSCT